MGSWTLSCGHNKTSACSFFFLICCLFFIYFRKKGLTMSWPHISISKDAVTDWQCMKNHTRNLRSECYPANYNGNAHYISIVCSPLWCKSCTGLSQWERDRIGRSRWFSNTWGKKYEKGLVYNGLFWQSDL
jgi:hypothetical protein